VITTLDRLGRSTQNMLAFAYELRARGAGLGVLNLGGGDVDTSTPMGSMLFTIMAALAQMDTRSNESASWTRSASGARPVRILAAGRGGSRTVRSATQFAWSTLASRPRRSKTLTTAPSPRRNSPTPSASGRADTHKWWLGNLSK
jgi:hypothetical protein